MTPSVAVFAASLALLAHSEPTGCEGGRVVKVRTLERAEGARGGPSPAAPDDRPTVTPGGALHFLTVECGGRTWEARVAEGAPGLRPDDLRPRRDVSVRVRGDRLFLKRSDGSELQTYLVPGRPGQEPSEEGEEDRGADHPR
jgi:hypothetical protein